MKIIISTFLLLIFSLSLSAQETTSSEKIRFGGAINVKKNTLKTDQLNDIKDGLGFSIEGSAYFKIHSKLFLKTGINLTQVSSTASDYGLRLGCDHDGNGGFDPSNSFVETKLNWLFIGIPAELQINFLNKKNRMYLKIGAELLISVVNRSVTTIYECGNPGTSSNDLDFHQPNTLNGQVCVGLGFEFPIQSKMKLFFEPNLEYIFTNTIDAKTILSQVENGKVLSIGGKVGVRF